VSLQTFDHNADSRTKGIFLIVEQDIGFFDISRYFGTIIGVETYAFFYAKRLRQTSGGTVHVQSPRQLVSQKKEE